MTFMAARIKQQHQPKKQQQQKLHETKVNIKTNKNKIHAGNKNNQIF